MPDYPKLSKAGPPINQAGMWDKAKKKLVGYEVPHQQFTVPQIPGISVVQSSGTFNVDPLSNVHMAGPSVSIPPH